MGFLDIVVLIFGAYMFCTAIYNMIMSRNSNGIIVNSVSVIVGGILVYIGISGKCSGGSSSSYSAASSSDSTNPFAGQGGRRRRR